MLSNKFGGLLRQLRVVRKLTQDEMANAIDRSITYYSAIEAGRKSPPVEIQDRLISFLDLDDDAATDFSRAAAESVSQVRINLSETAEGNRDVAMLFARRFASLDDDDITQLREILKEK